MKKSFGDKKLIDLNGGVVVLPQNSATLTPKVCTVRSSFSPGATLHKIQSPKLRNSFASNPLRKSLQALSEPKLGRNPEASVFLLKEGDSLCEQYQHGEKSKKQISCSRPNCAERRDSFKKDSYNRLLKNALMAFRYGALSAIMLILTSSFFCASGAETQNNSSFQSSGPASFYGLECCRYNPSKGCPTASGRSLYSLVKRGVPYAASWDFPFGTRLKVTNLKNGKSTVVVVLDRGPAKRLHRIVDLNKTSFSKIANTKSGVCRVKVEVLK